LLTLMGLIVVPLASALLWLGWHAVDVLEQRSVNQRMTALDYAVATTLTDGLRTITSVGLTLAEEPSFAVTAGAEADDERRRQLVAMLQRHPAVSAAFVGYPDGHFLYAGRLSEFPAERRAEFAAPSEDAIVVRTVDGEGAQRRETWVIAGGGGAPHSRPDSYDPRTRPWYTEAESKHAPVLTEPYRFAWSTDAGISAGLPMRSGGVIGFDFTLGTLSRLMGDYKVTPNAIVLISLGTSDVLIETDPCKTDAAGCYPEDAAARQVLRQAVRESGGMRLSRDVEAAGRDYKIFVHSLPSAMGRSLTIAAAVPLEELSADSRVLLNRASILAAVAVALAILAVLVTSLLVSRSTARLAAKTERIRHLDFSDTVPVRSHITEILRLSDAIERMREGLEVFGRYVSKDLVTQIMRSPTATGLGGTRRDLTVMFTDIEGFSRISESIEPELLTSRLSRYFEALGAAISGNRGMIDKYIGDSVMAFWNAPEPDPDHIANAVRAALQAAEASRKLADKWRERGRPAFRTRIGLHTGPALVGNVGARERINYTLVGAVANQASRLEGLNKIYGTDILASGEVAKATISRFTWRHIDRVVAAGTTEALEIYEPMGEIATAGDHAKFLDLWRLAHDAYGKGSFAEALAGFKAAQALRPDDAPCRAFIERCIGLARDGLPEGWDGAWHFDKK
jgi:adenylate cyclase